MTGRPFRTPALPRFALAAVLALVAGGLLRAYSETGVGLFRMFGTFGLALTLAAATWGLRAVLANDARLRVVEVLGSVPGVLAAAGVRPGIDFVLALPGRIVALAVDPYEPAYGEKARARQARRALARASELRQMLVHAPGKPEGLEVSALVVLTRRTAPTPARTEAPSQGSSVVGLPELPDRLRTWVSEPAGWSEEARAQYLRGLRRVRLTAPRRDGGRRA